MSNQIESIELTSGTKLPESGSDAVRTLLQALKLLLLKDMEGFVAIYAEDAVMEYPYAPVGWPKRLIGPSELLGHVHDYPDHLDIRRFKDLTIHETQNPELIVAEFTAEGVVTSSGQPYEVRYIDVVTVRNSRFIRYRDYWNPMLAMELVPQGLGHD